MNMECLICSCLFKPQMNLPLMYKRFYITKASSVVDSSRL
nr:MAG TPA: hypothetical protein [Caudoviricetes sp.]